MTSFMLNGVEQKFDGDLSMPPLWALRDHIGLTGTKFGCGLAQCGACTVHVDGVPVRSWQTFVGDIGGSEVTTIEGINGRLAETLQQVWADIDVPQCGYCQSGQIMSAFSPAERDTAAGRRSTDGYWRVGRAANRPGRGKRGVPGNRPARPRAAF